MKTTFVWIAMIVAATEVMAGPKPVQLSLTPDIAVFDRTERINGVSLSIWGENPQTALAVGLVNGSTGQSAGLSIGLLNYAENYKGLQWSFVNYTKGDFVGWQGGPLVGVLLSAVNYTGGSMEGLQLGAVNYAGRLTGLQFGLVNIADSVPGGGQIGLVNVIRENTSWFTGLPNELAPAMVLVNWRF